MKKIESIKDLEVLMRSNRKIFLSYTQKKNPEPLTKSNWITYLNLEEKENKNYERLLEELEQLKQKEAEQIARCGRSNILPEISALTKKYLEFEKLFEHINVVPLRKGIASLIRFLIYIGIVVQTVAFVCDKSSLAFASVAPVIFFLNSWFILSECTHDDCYSFIDRDTGEKKYKFFFHKCYFPLLWIATVAWFAYSDRNWVAISFVALIGLLTIASLHFKKAFRKDQLRNIYL